MRGNPLLAFILFLSTPAAAIELVADPQPHTLVRIKDSDVPARVALGFDKAMALNLDSATAARLRAFPIFGKRTVESSMIPGGRAVFRGNFYRIAPAGLKPVTAPVGWVDKPVDARFPAIVSIFAFDAPRVAIVRPGVSAGSRFVLRRNGEGDAQMDVKVGSETVRVSLDLGTPRTIMSARAAAALEETGLVRRLMEVGLWEPIPGVRLPYQGLVPIAGASVAGLPLVAPAARITEQRAREIDAFAKSGTSTMSDDDDAIVVTAKRDQQRGRRAWLIIGADVLNNCGRIELDRPGKRWLLDCSFSQANG